MRFHLGWHRVPPPQDRFFPYWSAISMTRFVNTWKYNSAWPEVQKGGRQSASKICILASSMSSLSQVCPVPMCSPNPNPTWPWFQQHAVCSALIVAHTKHSLRATTAAVTSEALHPTKQYFCDFQPCWWWNDKNAMILSNNSYKIMRTHLWLQVAQAAQMAEVTMCITDRTATRKTQRRRTLLRCVLHPWASLTSCCDTCPLVCAHTIIRTENKPL